MTKICLDRFSSVNEIHRCFTCQETNTFQNAFIIFKQFKDEIINFIIKDEIYQLQIAVIDYITDKKNHICNSVTK